MRMPDPADCFGPGRRRYLLHGHSVPLMTPSLRSPTCSVVTRRQNGSRWCRPRSKAGDLPADPTGGRRRGDLRGRRPPAWRHRPGDHHRSRDHKLRAPTAYRRRSRRPGRAQPRQRRQPGAARATTQDTPPSESPHRPAHRRRLLGPRRSPTLLQTGAAILGLRFYAAPSPAPRSAPPPGTR